jgi:hypothetical protein
MDFLKNPTHVNLCLLVLSALVFLVILYRAFHKKSENFQMKQSQSQSICKEASDAYCNARCATNGDALLGGVSGVSPQDNAKKIELLKNVLDSCGPDYKIIDYCNTSQPPCPIQPYDLILGGTHEKSWRPMSLVPSFIEENDPNVPQTKWGYDAYRPT